MEMIFIGLGFYAVGVTFLLYCGYKSKQREHEFFLKHYGRSDEQ